MSDHMQQTALRHPRVIAVSSGKGGVGKTTVSINLAVALSQQGQAVVLLDADLGLANVDVLLGLTPSRSLAEVIDGSCQLTDVLIDGPAGIRIVPAASGIQHMAELSSLERAGLIDAFSLLEGQIDVMVVDTAAGIAANTLQFCDAAQEVLIVVCDDPASITDAYATIKVLNQRSGRNRFRVLVNMVQDERSALRLFARLLAVTDRYLDVSVDYVGQIPFDPRVAQAVRRRRCVADAFPEGPATRGFKNLARTTANWPIPRWASGRMEFFVERMARCTANEKVALI
jgi:flagellar biosynthesis protein FlhG